MNKTFRFAGALLLGSVTVWSCMKVAQKSGSLVQIIAGADDAAYAKQIEGETPIKLADGLKINIWATDSLAPDPIAMSIDDQNRIYLTRTNRQKNSEFDIRGHRDWMTESIALQSVEDRRAFLRKVFDPQKSDDNDWLKDLNGDGSHDWRDLAVEQEEVWRLEDTDGDGLADVSTQVLKDFNEEITDVAGALLIRRNDAFIGLGPDLWRIEDTNGDGYYDKKTSIAHGFNIHIGFGGHGMSGLIEGPDGKIYWGIGDPGLSMIDQTGKKHHFPNQGVIVRCNPDGSDFEVFSHGHRNTHEFVFDEYGNLISSDNDGDHRGESERLVHIVEGSDSGWRINWQFGKYTDPRNNGYKIWMDEEMYKPRQEGQAAYFLPPIRNYHNGPTGMLYNPGTALGKDWLNKFFLVEFTGTPSRAHIWSFDLKQKGATFDFNSEVDMVNGVLATGIRFGTDGALYAADWINGWGTKDYGRIWKVDVEDNDLKAERARTKELMAADYEGMSDDDLYGLLFYGDQRIRQKAQFELATRSGASNQFTKAINQTENQLTRVHGIWGIGQVASNNNSEAFRLVPFLEDSDGEIVAQAAKVLGDVRYKEAGNKLTQLLSSSNPRIQFYAAQALGRIEHKPAVNRLLGLLEQNNDDDLYIRHAAVLALSRIGDKEPVYDMVNHPSKALRTAAVMVLRKWQDPKLADFLKDHEQYVVAEAARAINDDWSVPEALPALANLVNDDAISSEVILRRAINAALRVGGDKQLNDLLAFAQRADVSDAMKAEALATIGTWAEPSVLDRVDGRYRGVIKRDREHVRNIVIPKVAGFLDDSNEAVVQAAIGLLKDLGIRGFNNKMAGLYDKTNSEETKSAILEGLSALSYPQIGQLVDKALADKNRNVRTTALSLLNKVDVSADLLPGMVENILDKGSLGEKQQLLKSLGQMPLAKTESVFENLISQLKNEKLPKELRLDLSEAIAAAGSETLAQKLDEAIPKGNIFEEYADVLYGGSRRDGYMYFTRNETGQCIRCHAIGGQGGTVGPDLSDIGNTLERKELLQALVEPSARLAPGYGTVTLTLKDGQEVTGILEQETEDELILRTSAAEPLEVAKSRITDRQNFPSGMPPMASIMDRRQMRDVIEFLSNLKK
ncbi:HEAT repeat domain-containing protein [Jiulongibacter sediminis]|uniref:HEAT repeat domain-containing protein n=1 Tax=Jiulongibacter sediminis TaxID=1605367 RepID=UPI0026F317AE|nr:HEAT repeat domain-containing protein [Jiulongibacter sediminis]